MTDEAWMDIGPTTDYLRSLRSAGHSFSVILGELIDNAFDAGAKSVSIEAHGRKGQRDCGDLIVSDDGEGCDDLAVMLAPGKRKQHAGTKLGRFGIGSKDAAIWLWGTTVIRSVRGSVVREATADWAAIEASGTWKIRPPIESKAEPGDHGTRITFSRIEHRFPDGKNFDALVAELGYLYAPAIKRGLQIKIAGKGRQPIVVPRYELPRLEEVIDVNITVGNKRARVYVGVVPDGVDNPKPGITYMHGFRVIMQANGLGCGGKNYSRVCGFVELDGQWRLTKNKTGLDRDEEELGEAVFAAIRTVIERAAQQSMSIRNAALAQNLTAMLRGMATGEGDARRTPTGEKPGSIEPKDTDRKHRNARKHREGDSRRTINVGALSIGFKPCEEPTIGSVDLRGKMIWLAENHPWVFRQREKENVDALLSIALSLLAATEPDAQIKMPFVGGDGQAFNVLAGRLLRDQRPLKAVP